MPTLSVIVGRVPPRLAVIFGRDGIGATVRHKSQRHRCMGTTDRDVLLDMGPQVYGGDLDNETEEAIRQSKQPAKEPTDEDEARAKSKQPTPRLKLRSQKLWLHEAEETLAKANAVEVAAAKATTKVEKGRVRTADIQTLDLHLNSTSCSFRIQLDIHFEFHATSISDLIWHRLRSEL